MDVHPSRELVGSGQRGGRDRKSQAHVRIWSTESLQTLYVFGMGELDTGVLSVAFSQLNGGSYILAVDAGRESILSVWVSSTNGMKLAFWVYISNNFTIVLAMAMGTFVGQSCGKKIMSDCVELT